MLWRRPLLDSLPSNGIQRVAANIDTFNGPLEYRIGRQGRFFEKFVEISPGSFRAK